MWRKVAVGRVSRTYSKLQVRIKARSGRVRGQKASWLASIVLRHFGQSMTIGNLANTIGHPLSMRAWLSSIYYRVATPDD